MCGIVGIVGAQEPAWLSVMNAQQAHRGPDETGTYRDRSAGVGLAVSRLSVIDPRDGHQPMGTEDGRVWIAFNGEIYNASELRVELMARGEKFRTDHSDTEVLLRLYLRKGEAMLEELNGMFAFVIYDQRRRRLFGARDRLGIKPLYYLSGSGRFVFASELKSIMSLPLSDDEFADADGRHAPELPVRGRRKPVLRRSHAPDGGAPAYRRAQGADARRRAPRRHERNRRGAPTRATG